MVSENKHSFSRELRHQVQGDESSDAFVAIGSFVLNEGRRRVDYTNYVGVRLLFFSCHVVVSTICACLYWTHVANWFFLTSLWYINWVEFKRTMTLCGDKPSGCCSCVEVSNIADRKYVDGHVAVRVLWVRVAGPRSALFIA